MVEPDAINIGVEVTTTSVTVAGVTGVVRPSTLCAARFDWAAWVRTAATALPVPAMVPPLSAIAFAAQEIPFVSRSPLDPPVTAWENRSVVVPEPAYQVAVVAPPRSKAKVGSPVTVTGASKVIENSMCSRAP